MIPLAMAFLYRLMLMLRNQRLRPFTLVLLLAACGDGDGPAGTAMHPALAACTRYAQSTPVSCTEYRNISDADWASLNGSCDLVEDGTCSQQNTRGACRKLRSSGMTVTEWHYKCAASGESSCAVQPSQLQSECQAGGGTYIPPDEAG